MPLAYAFQRMVAQQRVIIEASRSAEAELRKTFPQFIPKFSPGGARATSLVSGLLWLIPIGLVALAITGFLGLDPFAPQSPPNAHANQSAIPPSPAASMQAPAAKGAKP